MKFLLYLLGFLPSIIWLLFYLRKDAHPESNRMILKVFFLGMLSACLAIVLEKGFQKANNLFVASVGVNAIVAIFLGGALIEEYVKYFVVKAGVFRNRELDEPPDLVLYMIISALGFAALENILVLSNYHPVLTPTRALGIMGLRFISATFLHALCSGVWGYFLALSFYHTEQRKKYFLSGLLIAVSLHGIYNLSIIKIQGMEKFIIPAIILLFLSSFVSYSFKKLKRLKSTCAINPKS